MQIETTRFGALDLDESTFIHFPWGIPGFEELKRYVLMDHREGPFKWLQAVDDPSIAFVVCPPDVVGVRYTVPEEKVTPILLQTTEDLVLLVMVSFDQNDKSLRLHLRGPLLFNASNRQAYQWTIDSNEISRFVENIQP
ncbi:MAG: flagellar assembly protein FliW [Syntrophobacteraceae bacterium]